MYVKKIYKNNNPVGVHFKWILYSLCLLFVNQINYLKLIVCNEVFIALYNCRINVAQKPSKCNLLNRTAPCISDCYLTFRNFVFGIIGACRCPGVHLVHAKKNNSYMAYLYAQVIPYCTTKRNYSIMKLMYDRLNLIIILINFNILSCNTFSAT